MMSVSNHLMLMSEVGVPDFSNTGSPLLDLIVDVGGGVLGVGLMVLWQMTKKRFVQLQQMVEGVAASAAQAAKDAAVTREHTENSHANAENPNLRDDLDAKFKSVAEGLAKLDTGQVHLATMIARVEEAQRRQDKELASMRQAQAADREDTRRVREALDEHISEKRDYGSRLDSVERELKTHRKKTETP